jgi:hypothetical protein
VQSWVDITSECVRAIPSADRVGCARGSATSSLMHVIAARVPVHFRAIRVTSPLGPATSASNCVNSACRTIVFAVHQRRCDGLATTIAWRHTIFALSAAMFARSLAASLRSRGISLRGSGILWHSRITSPFGVVISRARAIAGAPGIASSSVHRVAFACCPRTSRFHTPIVFDVRSVSH